MPFLNLVSCDQTGLFTSFIIIAVTQPARHSRRIHQIIAVIILCDELGQRWLDLHPPGLA